MTMRTGPVPASRQHAILADLLRVRLLTGSQIERLHFARLATSNSRGSARRRTLGRLVHDGLVTTLPRRVGGERSGSAGTVYLLSAAGYRLLRPGSRTRRQWPIGWPFVQHTLEVAELYVRLRERERAGTDRLLRFDAEPDSWRRASSHLTLKPDAYAVYEDGQWERHDWIEVDRATESLPTIRRKLMVYLDFAVTGVGHLDELVPRVLVTVPTSERRDAVAEIVKNLDSPALDLIDIVTFDHAFPSRPPPQVA